MSKHTPGPWTWVEDAIYGGYSGIVGPDGQEVLFANSANDGDEGHAWFEDFPTKEDRCLMTAAPDLLEALKAVLSELPHDVPNALEDVANGTASTYQRALVAANSAIAKAEGKEAQSDA